MNLLSRFRPKQDFQKILNKYFQNEDSWLDYQGNVVLLSKLVDSIRLRVWKSTTHIDLSNIIDIIEKDKNIQQNLKKYIQSVISNKRFYRILTDADIIKDASFFHELKQRIIAKFIPNQPDFDSLEYVLAQIFFIDNDDKWVSSIPDDQIIRLLHLFKSENQINPKNDLHPRRQLIFSINILANRIVGVAMESEVNKMVPEYASYENPFLGFQQEIQILLKHFDEDIYCVIDKNGPDYKQLMILHKHCVEFVEQAFKNIQKYGISIRVNQYLLRISQQLERLEQLIELLIIEENSLEKIEKKQLDLIKFLVSINYQKNNIRELLNKSTQKVSFEITQHKAKSGEHYITKDKDEYNKMLKAALGGGAIVGVLCIIKILLSKMELSPFGTAIFYSINYAVGFILIYLLGYTLATKQPAMTASKFVKSLQEGQTNKEKKTKYQTFAILFARLFRSQFIAFVGNVAMAFPVALLGVWVIDMSMDYNIAASKSKKLLEDINPLTSRALFHASIAGVYLFLSGVIAGNVSNRIKHNKIPFRIKEHPVLKLIFGRRMTEKFANYHEKKYPGILSNLWFGIFMGSTASIGYFLGLDLDIRHITFASGNLALGLYGAEWSISFNMLIWAIIGIGLIGFLNFIVSFTLSIIVAMRSCAIPILELRHIVRAIIAYLFLHPANFIYPSDDTLETENRLLAEEE